MTIWVTLLARAQAEDLLGDPLAGNDQGLAAKPLGQTQRVGHPIVGGLAGTTAARRSATCIAVQGARRRSARRLV